MAIITTVCVLGFSRETGLIGCICIEGEIYLENWLTRLWGLASPKFSGLASRLETWGSVAVQVQRQSAGKISPSGKVTLFIGRSSNRSHEAHSHYGR